MDSFSIFRKYKDPLEAEELIDLLDQHLVPYERTFEQSSDPEDYVGSNPFDADIVIKIPKDDFSKAEALLKNNSD